MLNPRHAAAHASVTGMEWVGGGAPLDTFPLWVPLSFFFQDAGAE
jgi:hypothetical protein